MRLAELIGRLTGPEAATVVVGRRTLIGAGIGVLLLAVWAVASVAYLLFQDDVAAHLLSQQVLLQQAYEDKIGALRTHLDRLTSQSLLDEDGLDRRVSELMARQAQIEERQALLGALSDRAGFGRPSAPSADALASAPSAELAASTRERRKPAPVVETFDLRLRVQDEGADRPAPRAGGRAAKAPLRERVAGLRDSLAAVESAQWESAERLLRGAEDRVSRLRDVLRQTGLNPDALDPTARGSGIGGPLVPIAAGAQADAFAAMTERLRGSVERLAELDRAAGALPFGRPVPGEADLTSGFGHRIDPFTRGPAMHTGLDFRAERGSPVRASGSGEVVSAEYAGGYGNMVEIDHGHGVTTRYAHLSTIAVAPGQRIEAGAVVGRAGSTGRSTGAHLHYETRIDGEAVDPQRFLRAGARLASLR